MPALAGGSLLPVILALGPGPRESEWPLPVPLLDRDTQNHRLTLSTAAQEGPMSPPTCHWPEQVTRAPEVSRRDPLTHLGEEKQRIVNSDGSPHSGNQDHHAEREPGQSED